MARVSLSTPTLRTARLRLRPFNDLDEDALFALHCNVNVMRYWDAPPWSERVRAEQFVAACREIAEAGTGARLAVDRVSDGAFIGWCSLTRWNPDFRIVSMGYCFDDAAWGHGYATEALNAAIHEAFSAGELEEMQACCVPENLASRGVLARTGFAEERTIRGGAVIRGRHVDVVLYRLTRADWRRQGVPAPSRRQMRS